MQIFSKNWTLHLENTLNNLLPLVIAINSKYKGEFAYSNLIVKILRYSNWEYLIHCFEKAKYFNKSFQY
jgi:hypothetical protein